MIGIVTAGVALAVLTGITMFMHDGMVSPAVAQTRPATREVPRFEPDPAWPKLPAKWVFDQVACGARSASRRRTKCRPRLKRPKKMGHSCVLLVAMYNVDKTSFKNK